MTPPHGRTVKDAADRKRMVFLSVATDAKGGASALLSPGGVYYLSEPAATPGRPRIWTIENEHRSVIGYLHERSSTDAPIVVGNLGADEVGET